MRPILSMAILLALVLAFALVAIPPAAAHGPPGEAPAFTRLLVDWEDDCGGDGGAATGACKGSHDLVALDIQEKRDPDLGDVVVLRLYADKGQAGARKDVITLTLPSGSKTFTFQTSDDRTFTNGGGFDRVSGPHPIPGEATRFYVEGLAKLASLGKVDQVVSGYKVEAQAGSAAGDFMPGGCHNTVGDCLDTGSHNDYTRQGGYKLRGPSYYARLTVPEAPVEVGLGSEQMALLQVTNLLAQPQRVMVSLDGEDGVKARFHNPADPSGSGHSERLDIDLPAHASSSVHLAFTGLTAEASGTIRLTLETDLGGHVEKQVSYQVTSSGSTCPPTGHGMDGMEPDSCTTSGTQSQSKTSPLPFLGSAAALTLAAMRRRTRRS